MKNRWRQWALSLLLATACTAQAASWWSITDPTNDDDGDGALRYPIVGGYTEGDLDIRSLNADLNGNDVWFKATFRNPVRSPALAYDDSGNGSLERLARNGFYQFNLDIYFDLDGKPRSGSRYALPGRQVEFADDAWWERAVILTPRPQETRDELIEFALQKQNGKSEADVAAEIDASVFFPTEVRVQGNVVRFKVPRQFLGSVPDRLGIVAMVTPASLNSTLFSSLSVTIVNQKNAKSADKKIGETADRLGVKPIALGGSGDAFQYQRVGAGVPPPIVDLLMPQDQHPVLLARQPLPAVRVNGVGGGDNVKRSVVMETKPEKPLNQWLNPTPAEMPAANAAAARPAAAVPAPANTAGDLEQRLQTLKNLFDKKLIDADEYKSQKQQILDRWQRQNGS